MTTTTEPPIDVTINAPVTIAITEAQLVAYLSKGWGLIEDGIVNDDFGNPIDGPLTMWRHDRGATTDAAVVFTGWTSGNPTRMQNTIATVARAEHRTELDVLELIAYGETRAAMLARFDVASLTQAIEQRDRTQGFLDDFMGATAAETIRALQLGIALKQTAQAAVIVLQPRTGLSGNWPARVVKKRLRRHRKALHAAVWKARHVLGYHQENMHLQGPSITEMQGTTGAAHETLPPKLALELLSRIEAMVDHRQADIYAASVAAPESEKVCLDSMAEMLGEYRPSTVFPIAVHGIHRAPSEVYHPRGPRHDKPPGTWVKVRPCAGPGKDKTYLGIHLGKVSQGDSMRFHPDTGVLSVEHSYHNPAIWVPDLRAIVFGAESWWGVIKGPDDLRTITDSDINGVFYVKALRELTGAAQTPQKALLAAWQWP